MIFAFLNLHLKAHVTYNRLFLKINFQTVAYLLPLYMTVRDVIKLLKGVVGMKSAKKVATFSLSIPLNRAK
jgi:hypothetical protein